MSSRPRNFDRLARSYPLLEYLAFGRDLERARFSLLPHLKDCRHILILGEGDGRCLERLVGIAPEAKIDCLDHSPAMLARAQKRLGETPHRVTFLQADILAIDLPRKHYDAIITCFFLDCFTNQQASEIIAKISRSLLPRALWLWSDFVLPPRGLPRIRAKIWLAILYTFFRSQTNLRARELPASETEIRARGFHPLTHTTLQWGFLRSAVYQITKNQSRACADKTS